MAKAALSKGLMNIRGSFKASEIRMLDRKRLEHTPLDPNEPRFGYDAGKWPGHPKHQMPPECPVRVLGHKGPLIYVMAASGEIFEFEEANLSLLTKLFAPHLDYLDWAWPGFGKARQDENGKTIPGKVKRVERDQVNQCLIKEAMKRQFDPMLMVRGRGGWKDTTGSFIWHSGEKLWISEKGGFRMELPGELDDMTYTVAKDIQWPWQERVEQDIGPGPTILKALRSWNWERPHLDPLFFLGWIITAYMSGALDWRPSIFITGGAGVGKSTLHNLLIRIMGETLFATANTTAAGIYQHLKQDSRPVAIDEMENDPESQKAQGLLDLARIAASGDVMYRGGANHEGTMFRATSSFAFFGINPPPLNTASMSRMAMLNLRRLEKGLRDLEYEGKSEDGAMLLRLVLDGWGSFNSDHLPRWKKALKEAGLSPRAQNTYGTLLAAAELAVGSIALDDMGFDVTEMARCGRLVAELTDDDISQQTENWLRFIYYMFGSTIEAWKGGEKPTVGGVIDELYETNGLIDYKAAKARLALAGLGLIDRGEVGTGYALAVPFDAPSLNRMFVATEWQGGGWKHALRQAPSNVVLKLHSKHKHSFAWIDSGSKRVIVIDLDAFRSMQTQKETD